MTASGRLDDLEMAVAHAERMLQDLSDVAAAQARELEALRRDNRLLAHRLEKLEAGLSGTEQGEDYVP